MLMSISNYVQGFMALSPTVKGFIFVVFMMLFLDGWKRIEFKRELKKIKKQIKVD